MTPIWIDGYYETEAEATHAVKEVWIGEGPEIVPLPALTLDQIEAWLKGEAARYREGTAPYWICRDLLAQVQAWKENP